MDLQLTPQQEAIKEAVTRICANYGDDYWLERDRKGGFPFELHRDLAENGWLGICMPESCGGAGLGITEAALMMKAIAQSGAGMAGASAIHMNVFALNPVAAFGTEEQKQRMISPVVAGTDLLCFAVTEPNTGLDTTKLKTKAERRGDRYVVNGRKTWISAAQVANKILLLARTTPVEEVSKRTEGLSLFYTDFDRNRIEVREIEKMGRKAVDSNQMFIDNLEIPVEDRIGEEGKALRYVFHGMNAERVLIAAEAVGLGQAALARAAQYAKERIVFERPIGKNQGVQHPLAISWVELEAAYLLTMMAAAQYDAGQPAGPAANAAKYFAAEAGYKACETAVMTYGGFGYAKEFHVERYLREIMIPRLAPVSQQLVLCNIAEKVLGLPKSY